MYVFLRKEGRKKGRLERDKTKIRTVRRNNEVSRKKKGMNGRVNERRGKTLWMKERKEGYKERF